MKKRALCVVLTLVLLLGMTAVTAYAVEGYHATIDDIDLGTAEVGYTSQYTHDIHVHNDGTEILHGGSLHLIFELTGGDTSAFVLTSGDVGSIGVGSHITRGRVTAASGLAAGSYSATLTASYDQDGEGTEYSPVVCDTATVTFTVGSPTSPIPSVGLSLTLPAAGGSYSGAVPAAVSVSSGTGFTVKSANWYNGGTPETNPGCGLAPTSFEVGKPYFAEIYLAPEEGYAFAGDTAVTIDALGVKNKAVIDSEADRMGWLQITTSDYTVPDAATNYTVTVNGGKAYNGPGAIHSEITSAGAGDKVYVRFGDSVDVPADKYLAGFDSEQAGQGRYLNLTDDDIVLHFTMPAENVIIDPLFEDQMTLTVDLTSGSATFPYGVFILLNSSFYAARTEGKVGINGEYVAALDNMVTVVDADKDGNYDIINDIENGFSIHDDCNLSGDYVLSGIGSGAPYTGITLKFPTSTATTSTVTVGTAENGTVSADKTTAAEGDTVTLTVTPAEGYELDTLTVKDAGGNPVTVTDNKFTMPASAVTVTAAFKEATRYLCLGTTAGGKYDAQLAAIPAHTDQTGGLNMAGHKGDAVALTAKPDSGYVFKGWYEGVRGSSGFVESNNGTLVSSSASYSFSLNENTDLQAVFEEAPAYSFTKGAGGEWTKGSGVTLDFTVKRSAADDTTISHFLGIEIDGASVGGSNYTAVSGSVNLSLKSEYLETLAAGEHEFTLVFDDGTASAKFTVKDAQQSGGTTTGTTQQTNAASGGGTKKAASGAGTSPRTGDETNVLPWAILLGASLLSLGAVLTLRKKQTHR